ncbi:XIAP-associated factor 1 [Sturnira hondurensis]|uniref:XIAP-associated factor 1 n=1 Tax=Sturnira hondurensis TaxID=192404 RepID=UPI00187AF279|nr:XIAP-associated factor 1 [Sturnira hondurensis]
MEGAVQVCRNCKRSMAPAHLALHEANCMLFLVLCQECKEPVPQAKMDEHCKTGHQQVGCAMCQQSMQRSLLEFHETTECQERPTECKFCGTAVRLSKLEVHEQHCGSRTELCLDCGQLVVVRGLAQHKDLCQREQAQPQRGKRISAPKNSISRRDCHRMTPGNKPLHHLDKGRTVSEYAKCLPIGEPAIPPPSLPSQAAEDQTSAAKRDVRPKTKNINKFPLLSETSRKQAPSDTTPQITSPVEDEAAYDILRRCPQCDILLPLPTLNQHQEKCWWLASLKGKQVRNFS